MVRICCVIAVIAVAASTVSADDGEPTTFHKGQFGLSARLGLGAYGVITYDHKNYCGELDSTTSSGFAPVCTGRMPIGLDLEASYGVARSIELTVELRLGLEHDFGATAGAEGPRPLHVAPGARFFFSEAKRSKLFVQPELVFDFTGYKDSTGADRGADFGVRGIEGFWVDLHRAYGIYVYISETATFSRWIYAGFEGGFGFQGRYP